MIVLLTQKVRLMICDNRLAGIILYECDQVIRLLILYDETINGPSIDHQYNASKLNPLTVDGFASRALIKFTYYAYHVVIQCPFTSMISFEGL